MCTAATYRTKDFYFGRTLDYEISYGDQIVVTPRNYAFPLRNGGELKSHYAMIGMACVMQDYPLYYDAANEKGLCIAGLNFVGNAYYGKPVEGKDNLAQFELIPWLLGSCASVKEVRQLLPRLRAVRPTGSPSRAPWWAPSTPPLRPTSPHLSRWATRSWPAPPSHSCSPSPCTSSCKSSL